MATGGKTEEVPSLAPILSKLDQDQGSRKQCLAPGLLSDSDAFDSMAMMNSEIWNEGEPDEGRLSRDDLLPIGVSGLSREDLEQTFLKAAQMGVLEAVEDIYKFCGPTILHTTDEDEYTALHRASYNGHVDVAEYLLSKGAKIDAKTVDGWQPLHCACRWNKAKVASLLLQNGALVNAQSNGRQTPLHLAASNDQAKATLELLLSQRGIDVSLRNGQDETAFQLAQRNGRFSYLFEVVEEAVDYRKFLYSS